MRMFIRRLLDRAFTSATAVSVLLMAAALALILGPIVWRGASAVVFRGTVEFRRMQLGEFHRGDADAVKAEADEARAARQRAWAVLDEFSDGILIDRLRDRARDVTQQFDAQLQNRVDAGTADADEARSLRRQARKLRKALVAAYESTDTDEALESLAEVLESPARDGLKGTAVEELFRRAAKYRQTLATIDLANRARYAEQLEKVSEIMTELLGPRARDAAPSLAQLRYGATRWDRAEKLLDELIWAEKWVATAPGRPLVKVRVRRADQFKGTPMAELFGLVERDLPAMLRPRMTFYWQYLIDNSTQGHFFGGVGPEALGTLMLTALAMLAAVPVGVITAAYLVECTTDSVVVRVLRTCINTLAGVPSIVFGLFGLAFFVLWLLPRVGVRGSSVLAGSLTLAVLVLPIIIRASEEAIRSVPRSYKEASLALGAGGVRTFVTVTLPAALPGILTGIILSMSRAAGETAPILFTAAVASGPWPGSIFKPCRTLSYGALDIATGDRLAPKVPHNQFGMVLVLVLLVLALNVAAIVIRSRISKRLRGG